MGWLFLIFIILFIYVYFRDKIKQEKRTEALNKLADLLKQYAAKYNIKIDKGGVSTLKSINDSNMNTQMYLFYQENQISICRTKIDLEKEPIIINTDSIKYFDLVGDFYTKTDVTGGGSNIGKAVVGGVVAGSAGAVVASRNKVQTTTTEVDKRQTILFYSQADKEQYIIFDSMAYDFFIKYIPQLNFKYK